jgi:regulator of sigma E protease
MFILQLLLFVAMLGILIALHELGHFLAAKAFNVYVFEFAVGMGPKVLQKKGKETKYTLRLLPIGGYVAMMGEAEDMPDDVVMTDEIKGRSLKTINRGKKAVIMSAGIAVNLVLGLVIFAISNLATTQTQLTTALNVSPTSEAYTLGLRDDHRLDFEEITLEGGVLQSFGDATVSSQTDKTYYVLFQPTSFADLTFGEQNLILIEQTVTSIYQNDKLYTLVEGDAVTMTLIYLSGDSEDTVESHQINLTLQTEVVDEDVIIPDFGLTLSKYEFHYTFAQAMQQTGKDFVTSITAVARGLASLFTPSGIGNVSGPVGIFTQVSGALVNFGIGQYLFYWGLISVNLALFNLLPFPGLDGWHLVVTAFEAVTRKEINPKVKNIVSSIGLILLLGLSFVILLKDIVGLF